MGLCPARRLLQEDKQATVTAYFFSWSKPVAADSSRTVAPRPTVGKPPGCISKICQLTQETVACMYVCVCVRARTRMCLESIHRRVIEFATRKGINGRKFWQF